MEGLQPQKGSVPAPERGLRVELAGSWGASTGRLRYAPPLAQALHPTPTLPQVRSGGGGPLSQPGGLRIFSRNFSAPEWAGALTLPLFGKFIFKNPNYADY